MEHPTNATSRRFDDDCQEWLSNPENYQNFIASQHPHNIDDFMRIFNFRGYND